MVLFVTYVIFTLKNFCLKEIIHLFYTFEVDNYMNPTHRSETVVYILPYL